MKKMNYEEFSKRTIEVAKAMKIFSPHITNNISEAFEIYQKVLAEEEMSVFISTAIGGNKPPSIIDGYERPKCPECGKDMRLKIKTEDQSGKEWNTSWNCIECSTEYYSYKTLKEWMEELRKNV